LSLVLTKICINKNIETVYGNLLFLITNKENNTMALAIVLMVLLIGSVIFNFNNPWGATPVASNWGSIDDTIAITFVITGIFFVAITLFIALALVKFRYRKTVISGQHPAENKPDNKKLELWLTVITTVGICLLLAPGLKVYSDFVEVPPEAVVIEVVAKQWQWRYRLPGADGLLGKSTVAVFSTDNAFAIDPLDPAGQDDIVIASSELHLLIDQPVKFLLRSLDVLHNFYVPQFRAKMDMVPGQVSYFWMTPITLGSFEVLCAEYCGIAHYNMRGTVVVDNAEDYQSWLDQQPTFGSSQQRAISEDGIDPKVQQGRLLAQNNGCFACHSIDGSSSLGPGWKNIMGREETLVDDSTIVVDEAYFRSSILNPSEQLVKGFPPVMAPYPLSQQQTDAIIAFVRSISD
jgi:cytochrome c oxidase subunit 2